MYLTEKLFVKFDRNYKFLFNENLHLNVCAYYFLSLLLLIIIFKINFYFLFVTFNILKKYNYFFLWFILGFKYFSPYHFSILNIS